MRLQLIECEIICVEQANIDWLTAFAGTAEHRNSVKFWFADVGVSMGDTILGLVYLQIGVISTMNFLLSIIF